MDRRMAVNRWVEGSRNRKRAASNGSGERSRPARGNGGVQMSMIGKGRGSVVGQGKGRAHEGEENGCIEGRVEGFDVKLSSGKDTVEHFSQPFSAAALTATFSFTQRHSDEDEDAQNDENDDDALIKNHDPTNTDGTIEPNSDVRSERAAQVTHRLLK